MAFLIRSIDQLTLVVMVEQAHISHYPKKKFLTHWIKEWTPMNPKNLEQLASTIGLIGINVWGEDPTDLLWTPLQ
jgi:hypothetical protein